MAVKTGRSGNIKVGSTPAEVANMESWKLSLKQNLIDATHFGNGGWESYAPGIKGWEGSIEGSWNITGDVTGQKVIQDAFDSGAEIDLELYVDENQTGDVYKGKALIESIDVDTSVKDKVKLSVKFKGNGPLTFPTTGA